MGARDLRISVRTRTDMDYFSPIFPSGGDFRAMHDQANEIAQRYNSAVRKHNGKAFISSGKLHATGVLHLLYQTVITRYLIDSDHDFFSRLNPLVSKNHACQDVLSFYAKEFPSPLLMEQDPTLPYFMEETIRGFFVHQVMLANPALIKAAKPFMAPEGLTFPPAAQALSALMGGYTKNAPVVGKSDEDLFSFLTRPAKVHPDSLIDQIRYIIDVWADLLPEDMKLLLLRAIDVVNEEDKPRFIGGGPGPTHVPDYASQFGNGEYEAFTADRNWMPNVVMIAKSTLVWLDQLSKLYGYPINTLDQIPDRELDLLHERGFTALWLIGLWERSTASKTIKNLCGNPEAEASAYSLKGYEIASSIGGWSALENLRRRCADRQLRLASDMVPNHTGIDGDWVMDHPEYFIQQDHLPFPSYTYNGPDLSPNPDIEIKLEDHYYNRTDAAVTFRRTDRQSGRTSYIFHGNDGTSMPWNDTAQLDFLNPMTREAVIQQIMHVARNFPIIRFDAAMTLAKKHIQRLWYPRPGSGGDIAGRAIYSMSDEEFNRRIPSEFWREVVDRVGAELPDTLLLAEAFWMMEGYFVRTLGMHRVYNSAFMNMLKNQENKKYRDTIKNTISFDPEILKRFVNFMNNPDEETAVAQFGDGDKYFGVCTLLATMPGLPMFGHGQLEGYREKYGMEYRRAYWDEKPNDRLLGEHYRRIFPLLRKRYLFSGVDHFELFDMYRDGQIQESAFAYANGDGQETALVLYNNQYEAVEGNINTSVPKLYRQPDGSRETKCSSLAESFNLTLGGRRFLIYEEFPTGLTYLVPTMRIFDEGMWFHLDGYQSKVLLNIREVEDIDGCYGRLYGMLGGRGVEDLEQELLALRLQPVFKAMDNFHSDQMFKLIRTIINGESTSQNERKLLLLIGEAYTHLGAVVETMHPVAAECLPRVPQEIRPSQMLQDVQRFARLFQVKGGHDAFFLNGGKIMDELPVIVSAAMFLKPFIKETDSISDALTAVDRLLLSRFFRQELTLQGFQGEAARKVCHGAGLFASAAFTAGRTILEGDTEAAFKALLADRAFRDYIGCNEYQNVIWYTKESLQDAIFLVSLSTMLFCDGADFDSVGRFSSEMFARDSRADYKISGLFGQA